MQDFAHPQTDDQANAIDITFDSQGNRLILLGFLNGVLKVLSLGLYSFWAKTEVRRRIWSFTRVNGEPLEYTGTGKELFLGFLVVFFLVLLPLMLGGVAVALLFRGTNGPLVIYQLAAYGLFFLLLGNALYRAQRYRLSRTRWRGIRGDMVGSPARYGWTYFWTIALPLVIVLGAAAASIWAQFQILAGAIIVFGLPAILWILPWRSNLLQRQLTNNMRFGDQPLRYSGTSGPLYKRYVFAWVGSAVLIVAAFGLTAFLAQRYGYATSLSEGDRPIPTISEVLSLLAVWFTTIVAMGLVTAWYRASQYNHFAAHTHIHGATFSLSASGKSLMWLFLSNWMITIFGIILALAIGGFLIFATGTIPPTPIDGAPVEEPGAIPVLLALLPIILMTTAASTYIQFRTARYFLSRLKITGPVDLAAIQQSANAGPRLGEGLAQAFDLDAF